MTATVDNSVESHVDKCDYCRTTQGVTTPKPQSDNTVNRDDDDEAGGWW